MSALTKMEAKALLQEAREDTLVVGAHDGSLDLNDLYPVAPHPFLAKSIKSGQRTTLANRVLVLNWDRSTSTQVDQEDAAELEIIQKDLREKFYFTASAANPWDNATFTKWRHVIETSVLQTMQSAYKGQEDDSLLRNVFGAHDLNPKPDATGQTNMQGLVICHPIILDSPWSEPPNLQDKVLALAMEKKPEMVQKANATEWSSESDKAKSKLNTYLIQVTTLLRHMYKANSHTLHVLFWDIFPGAREQKNVVFTQLMEERNQHLIKYRAGVQGYEDHTAKDTLDFLLRNFVKTSEDSAHIAWTNILLHTRQNGVKIYDWLRSIQPLVRVLIESQKKSKKLSKTRRRRINELLVKQVTDNEQIQIGMLEVKYSADNLLKGKFVLEELVSMIATNIQKFNHRPYQIPATIKEYLRVRDKQHGKELRPLIPLKKRKRRDVYNIETEEPGDETFEKDIWDESYEDTEGSQQPHLDLLAFQQKPYEHRKCATAFCIAQKIDHTHNTSNCYNKGKDPNAARGPRYPRGIAPLSTRINSSPGRTALLMTPKGGKGQRQQHKGKPKGYKGKGRGKGKASRAPRFCTFCKQDGHTKDFCRKLKLVRNNPTYKAHVGSHGLKAQLCFEMLEDSTDVHECLWCEDDNCNLDGTCQAHVHDDDEEIFSECFASYIDNGIHDIVVAAKRDGDDSILPVPAEHLLAQEEGASEESPSSKKVVRPLSSDNEQ